MYAHVECPSCGKSLRAKPEYAGKVIRCPKCGQPMRLPETLESAQEPPADAARVRPEPVPAAVPGGGGARGGGPTLSGGAVGWIIGGVVGGVLLLAGGIVLLLLLLLGGASFEAYVPDSANVLAHVDVAGLVHSDTWAKLKELGGDDFDQGLEQMTSATGVKLEDLQEAWVAMDSSTETVVAMVTVAGTVDLKQVFEEKLKIKPTEEDGQKLYDVPTGRGMVAHLVDNQTIVIGPREAVKKGIQRAAAGERSKGLAALEHLGTYVSSSDQLTVAVKVDGDTLTRGLPGPARQGLAMLGTVGASISKLKGGALSGSVNGAISLSLAIVFDSAETAQQLEKQINETLEQARKGLSEAPAGNEDAAMAKQLLDGLSLYVRGEVLCANLGVDLDLVVKLAKKGMARTRRRVVPPTKPRTRSRLRRDRRYSPRGRPPNRTPRR